tara:strand:+ start:27 stop:137 length:111 start_codon:yes stop_codon:yes gene_type:complete
MNKKSVKFLEAVKNDPETVIVILVGLGLIIWGLDIF